MSKIILPCSLMSTWALASNSNSIIRKELTVPNVTEEVDSCSLAQWHAPVIPAAVEVGPGGQTADVWSERKGGWKGLEEKGFRGGRFKGGNRKLKRGRGKE